MSLCIRRRQVALSGGYAYLSSTWIGDLRIVDLRDLRQPRTLGKLSTPGHIWDIALDGSPTGERAYLARLRCAGGAAPRVGARGEGGVDAFGTLAGVYEVACGGTAARLYFDMYHEEHVEDRAPAGFTLAPR